MTTPTPEEEISQWLHDLFSHMELDLNVTARQERDQLELDITGPDIEKVLPTRGGSRGAFLRTLQSLLQGVSFASRGRQNIVLDAGGFRRQRADALASTADYVGAKAHETSKSITILGMNSFDRRAVHMGLQEDKRVTTQSEGFGAGRRLKIQP